DHKFWSDVESRWRAHAKRYLLRNVARQPANSAWPDDVEPYTRAVLNRRTDKLRNKASRSRWAERAKHILADSPAPSRVKSIRNFKQRRSATIFAARRLDSTLFCAVARSLVAPMSESPREAQDRHASDTSPDSHSAAGPSQTLAAGQAFLSAVGSDIAS